MLGSNDLCFAPSTAAEGDSSNACWARPAQGNTVIFGCEPRGCGSKWALLIGPDDKLLAIATTDFATTRWSGLRSSGQDIMLFVEDADYPRDEIRRTLGAWYLLPQHFVHSDGVGGLSPDFAALNRIGSAATMYLTIRECVLR